MIKNDNATLSMDFLTAISVLSLVFLFSVVQINALMTPYSVNDNRVHLDSVLSVLLSPHNENGLSIPHQDVLDGEKVAEYYVIHEGKLNWYELSDTQTFRNFGFEKYQYYSQILPLNSTKFDIESAEQSAKNHVPEFGNIDSAVRFKNLKYTESGVFYGKDLYGKIPSHKVIIYFDKDDVNNISGNTTMTFKDFTPKNDDTTGKLITFEVGTEVGNSEEIKTPKGISPLVSVNGEFVDIIGGVDINLTDIVKMTISEEQLNGEIFWQDGFYFQFNVGDIIIQNGTTYHNSSIHEISEPYRISVWSW